MKITNSVEEFLQSLEKKQKWEASDSFNSALEKKTDIYPKIGGTFDNIKMPDERMSPDIFPEAMRNKRLKLKDGVYLHLSYTFKPHETTKDSTTEWKSDGYNTTWWYTEAILTVALEDHGFFTMVATQMHTNTYKFKEVTSEKRWNNYYTHNVLTFDTRWVPDEKTCKVCYGHLPSAKAFLDGADLSKLEADGDVITFKSSSWYDRTDAMLDATLQKVDYRYFVEQDVSDGVYKPSKSFVDRFSMRQDGPKYGKKWNFPKDLLLDLGVHAVYLRADAYFDVSRTFNLRGKNGNAVELKTTPKVLLLYPKLKDFVRDEKTQKEVASIIRKEKQARAEAIYNNTYTLSFHGKVVMEASKEEIIEYLETATNGNVQEVLADVCKKIMEEYELSELILGKWGTYYKYELAGEKRDFEWDIQLPDGGAEENPEEIVEMILDSYDKYLPGMTNRQVEDIFGWPERGGSQLVARKKGKRVEIEVEDVDIE